MNTTTTQNAICFRDGSDELAEKLLHELAGGRANICAMMGVKVFHHLLSQPGEHLGGVAFTYNPRLVSNRSNVFRLYALESGLRRMEWFSLPPYGKLTLVEGVTDVPPDKLEKVWWEHTGCALRMLWALDTRQMKFETGQMLITRGVTDNFSENEWHRCIERHVSGDWGDLCEEDIEANQQALKTGDRLLSAYKFPDGRKVYVITEAADDDGHREATTALLPSEY